MKRASFGLGSLALLVAACGPGAKQNKAFLDACRDHCAASTSVACDGNPSLDACQRACDDIVRAGVCMTEHLALYGCAAKDGYRCESGAVVPAGSCEEQQAGVARCNDETPCRTLCDKEDAGGCGRESCVSDCLADMDALGECSPFYRDLADCWVQDITCSEGRPIFPRCESDYADVALCITEADPCGGACFSAGAFACEEDCLTQCHAHLDDAKCGSTYRSFMACEMETSETPWCLEVPFNDDPCFSSYSAYEDCTTSM